MRPAKGTMRQLLHAALGGSTWCSAALVALIGCATTTPSGSDIGRASAGVEPEEAPATNDDAPPPAPSTETNASEPDDAPLQAAELEVPEFGRAVVVLPRAAMRPAPILVAAHGAGDAPEWQCEHWGAVARGR